MKHSTKAFAFWLPAMVCVTLLGWLLLGALPNMKMTGDLIAWLMELPVITCYAIAAAGATFLSMHLSGSDLCISDRNHMIDAARKGDDNAKWLLNREARAWFLYLALFAIFFYPHR